MTDQERVVALLRAHGDPTEVAALLGTDLGTVRAVMRGDGGASLPSGGGGGGGGVPDFSLEASVDLSVFNGYDAGTGNVVGPSQIGNEFGGNETPIDPYDSTVANLVIVRYSFADPPTTDPVFIMGRVTSETVAEGVMERVGGVHNGDLDSFVVPPGCTPAIEFSQDVTVVEVRIVPLT